MDIAARVGDDLTACRPSRVVEIGSNGRAGTFVKLEDDLGNISTYAHLNSVARGLREGQMIDAGHVIGEVRMTGNTSGPHLHLAVTSPNGTNIEPLQYVKNNALALPVHQAAYGAEAPLHARRELEIQLAQATTSMIAMATLPHLQRRAACKGQTGRRD